MYTLTKGVYMDIPASEICNGIKLLLEINNTEICRLRVDKIRIGFLFRLKSFWVGIHYSDHDKRFCINIVPCVTIWIVKKGGFIPRKHDK